MAKKLRVPDAPGGIRFCTVCDSFLPVGEFPLGPRRYSCKKHMWATGGQRAKAKRMADTNKMILFRLWGKAYDDSKRFQPAWRTLDDTDQAMNHANISITQREIEQLLCIAAKNSSMAVYDHLQASQARTLAIVPVNPKEVLSLCNAALVPTTVKRQLFRSWKLDGLGGYTNLFQESERSTNSVFRPSPEQIELMQSMMNSLPSRATPPRL
ncbi:hypothetical protein T484DRAFT_3050065 [Baffinella frigidus]|jgi:hypothetical protein|nr:hypothetical protein T484DRAFT_3050065 [Cryptophyta sp. CCMP2293]